jgi:hypothetical protein
MSGEIAVAFRLEADNRVAAGAMDDGVDLSSCGRPDTKMNLVAGKFSADRKSSDVRRRERIVGTVSR